MRRALNLHAGIGGNRVRWRGVEVTAVEHDPEIAASYRLRFPDDEVVVGDALEYLEKHYHRFGYIWASPPCPKHSQYRHNVGVLGKGFDPVIPDMSLYGIIVFLDTYFEGWWTVENVVPYYEPLIPPRFTLQRHLFWANFDVPEREFDHDHIRYKSKISDFDEARWVLNTSIKNKRKVLRNQTNPAVAGHIFDHIPWGSSPEAEADPQGQLFDTAMREVEDAA